MYTIQWRRGPASEWAEDDRILRSGEPGVETDTGRYKIGDGISRWSELPYFVDENDVMVMIQGFTSSNAALNQHINAPLPHPIYDEGPSLLLLYENAKV